MISVLRLSIPGAAFVLMLAGEIFTSRPRVKGNPVSVVVSNFKKAVPKSIRTCRSVSPRLPALKLMVKKFGSCDDASLMSPNA